MLNALADGEKDAARLAALADPSLRATQQELCDARSAAAMLNEHYRRVLKQFSRSAGIK